MPATPARAEFVAQEFRSATWSDSGVRTLYGKVARDTGDSPIQTFFDNVADAQVLADERGALLGAHARAFRVRIAGLMDLDTDLDMSTVLPAATLIDDVQVANMAVVVANIESYDTADEQTVLAVWGTL